jgi:DivIVA domain-containing protein
MLTPDAIQSKEFEQSVLGGYRRDEVDAFLDELEADYRKLYTENSELVEKLKVCLAKIEDYKKDEEFLKTAIINAQKLNETTLREIEIREKEVEVSCKARAAEIISAAEEQAKAILDKAERESADAIRAAQERCRAEIDAEQAKSAEEISRIQAETAAERVRKINPDCTVTTVNEFADGSNVDRILTEANADYVVDAIDCVTTKLLIALWAQEHNVPVISSMGTGNKLDPSKFVVTDISKTSVCPLARVMRRECKARGIKKLTVLYSTEEPVKTGLRVPASISYVPSCAGLMIAGHVIRSIINE